jgi:CHAT domain-containing protein
LESYGKALKEFEASANKIEMARVHSLIGNVYYSQDNYDAALDSYRSGLALRVEMDDKSGQGDILAGIGATLLKQQNYSEALDSYQRALELFNAVGNKERIADVLTRLSEAFLWEGDYVKALSAAENAASLARQLDSVNVLWYALMLSGKAHRGLDHATEAYQAFTNSISIVESLRSRPASIEGSERSSHLPYLAAMDLLVEQNRAGEAFDYAERAKVQALSELLRSSNAKTKKGLTAAEIAEEQRLAGQAASFELQLDREGQLRTSNEIRRRTLRDRLSLTRAAYADFREKLFVAHPRLKIERGELAPLQIDEIRSLLIDPQTALIEYTITEKNAYLFVLTVDSSRTKNSRAKRNAPISLKIYPLNVRNQELALRVRELEQLLATRSDDYSRAARELYDLLLKPAGDQLVLKTKMIVVPDGVLWRLPFEALQPTEDHFVADQMQVSYAPSLSALRDMWKPTATRRTNAQLSAFAMPTFTQQFNQRLELAYTGRKLETNEQQGEEVRSVSNVYGTNRSQVFTGTDASEERFKTEATRAGILHVAVPALLDDTSAMSSFIGLAGHADKNSDGFLQAREIMNMQTSAQLVVLSGAQSSGNYAGGATLGWAWSWFVAGSPTTMLTRWEVKSPALTQLLTQFYSQQRSDPRITR